MVIENSNEKHIKGAMWRFPVYMFLINLFVIPIALGGLLLNGGDSSNADYFVLHLPLESGHPWLAVLVFIGGFSASAGMVMVESVALSTMILNHLVMPVILRLKIEAADISGLLIIKRLDSGRHLPRLFYFKIIGESYALVNIGLVSFVAAQFASPIGGLYWKRATCAAPLQADSRFTSGSIPAHPFLVRSGWMSDILERDCSDSLSPT
jgi:Na+/proline symporter